MLLITVSIVKVLLVASMYEYFEVLEVPYSNDVARSTIGCCRRAQASPSSALIGDFQFEGRQCTIQQYRISRQRFDSQL
jgi:hypothetical protein